MRRLLEALIFVALILVQDASAVAFDYASIDIIRGRVISIDTKTGFSVDGYTIELDDGIDTKALAKVRQALISDTQHEYRKFNRPKRSQALLLILKTEKLKIAVGDRVEVRGYAVVGGSDNDPKLGQPSFKSFTKIIKDKKNG